MPGNRVAVVTGAARNIGRAVALMFAAHDYDLVLNSRSDSDDLQRCVAGAEDAGARVSVVVGDVADRTLAHRVVSVAQETFQGVDVLVHVPSARPVQPFHEIEQEDWDGTFQTNTSSLFWLCQAVLPGMVDRGWGRIIGFSGAQMVKGEKSAHVAASKAAVIGMIHSLAIEYAPHGITANIVVPGTIDTERASEYWLGDAGRKRAALAPSSLSLPPVGRMGRPEEVARLCAYIASDDAGFVTGQSLHINGGSLLS